MSGVEIIDATDLFEFTQEGIITEDFAKAKEWIKNNVEIKFAGKRPSRS